MVVFQGTERQRARARAAHLVLPSAAYVEREGTFTNFAGPRPALPDGGRCRSARRGRTGRSSRRLARGARRCRPALAAPRAEQVFRGARRRACPPSPGMTYRALGDARPRGEGMSGVAARSPRSHGHPGRLRHVRGAEPRRPPDLGRAQAVGDHAGPRSAPTARRIFGIRAASGLLHPLADAVKMLTKEDFMPARADRLLFMLAPVRVGLLRAGRPSPRSRSATPSRSRGREIQLQAVTLNVGILYVLAMLSLGVYGLMMAGWASANNYALLGGQRAAALMISAEVAIGASIMGVVHGLRLARHAGHRARPGPAAAAAVLRELDPRLGHPDAAARPSSCS